MIQFKSDQNYFSLNDVPYQRGKYRIRVIGDRVGIAEIGCDIWIANLLPFSEWLDSGGTPFASLTALRNELRLGLFIMTM